MRCPSGLNFNPATRCGLRTGRWPAAPASMSAEGERARRGTARATRTDDVAQGEHRDRLPRPPLGCPAIALRRPLVRFFRLRITVARAGSDRLKRRSSAVTRGITLERKSGLILRKPLLDHLIGAGDQEWLSTLNRSIDTYTAPGRSTRERRACARRMRPRTAYGAFRRQTVK